VNEQEFFSRYGDHHVRLYFYECEGSVSVEDLYRIFKDRMQREEKEAREEV
jgi:hypothetical protein